MDAQNELPAPPPRSARAAGVAKSHAFELKGMVAPLTVLQLRTGDAGLIAVQLGPRVAQMPRLFQDAPVLVDLVGLGQEAKRVHFGDLAALLRSCRMVPVAVTNAEEDVRARAAAAGFGYVAPPAPRSGQRAGESSPPSLSAELSPAPEPAPAAIEHAGANSSPPAPEGAQTRARSSLPGARSARRPTVVIRHPVRSGQSIYAEGADLVVLAPVSSGAEVIADGHVHIYSTLRGRAEAGAHGMTDARIFCQRLDAELVAISGAYLLAEDLSAAHRGKPAQIYLENGCCLVAAL
jgi:septum site-determining protein MinC